ncbi:serine protease [Metabacillus litoralis]|uniref:S1 family peptidase n=1 Tax=Metabacillus litoralis TaxID=152268 RepID=UPI00203F37C7|nr:trypsin-like peptidase domain-containing protein [Metabacillus litoralis]MCM3651319.1 trypsin-like peptidase domain-containing protein [Metabacillus litoralis]
MATNAKWKKAVVHLECVGDTNTTDSTLRLQMQLNEGLITFKDFSDQLSNGSRNRRYHGTAVLLEDEEKKYLITARHVVFDEVESDIFPFICRVKSKNETLNDNIPNFMMNLSSGSPGTRPYLFSTPELDLAIISLNSNKTRAFLEELLNLGYEPINVEDIFELPEEEGKDITAIGYPNYSIVDYLDKPYYSKHWSSQHISLPVFSFGKVAMIHNELDYFWGDISIYPGNSGGPVIYDGKLVGIVSAQPTIPSEINGDRVRIPFAKVIKAKYVQELIDSIKEVENYIDDLMK